MAAAVSFAPPDPTLPKPWKGLIDGNTGSLYFWNTETNATQYERPVAAPPSPAPQRSAAADLSNGSQIHQSEGDRENGSYAMNGVAKVAHDPYGVQAFQSQGARDVGPYPLNGMAKVGHESSGVPVSRESGEAYRRQHEITVTGGNIPLPFITFESSGFPSEILKEVIRAGFASPTPIQAQSWPIVLESRDIVAIAKTGSGKTLGYLIPGFIHLKQLHSDPRAGPTVLVLSPTRELATQIQDEAVKFGSSSRISCTCLYGGAPKGPQLRDIQRGVDVVVATPGRLNDILEMRRISLRQVSYLVLDEADRMLDMGFEPQIRKIVKEIPSRRQTLMFTATWPNEVRKIAADLLVNPVQVNIGNVNELVANKAITQHVEVISPMEKQRRVEQILRSNEPGSKIIIFCSTKRMCDQLSRSLGRFGAAAIHGDKSQGERDSVLSRFKSGSSPILVATDVAARGLDIKDIRVVINYDFPTGVEDYVHRIGRTGRGGATGASFTFFCSQDSKHASGLVKVLEGSNQIVPAELLDMVSRGGFGGKARRWGSDNGGRGFNGGGRGGFGNGRNGGFNGPPSSGWSASFSGGDRESSRERYGHGYQNESRDIKATNGGGSGGRPSGHRSRSRSRSRSPGPSRYAGTGSARVQ